MKKFLLCIALLPASYLMSAEDRAIGGGFSYQEFSLTYETPAVETTRYALALNIDMTGVIAGEYLYPGVSADFTYQFIFASKQFRNGESLHGLAGPGVKAGYARGESGKYGLLGGICGIVGLEYRFTDAPVSLSLAIQPVLAFHISRAEKTDMLRMDLNKKAMLQSLLPKIGIRYNF